MKNPFKKGDKVRLNRSLHEAIKQDSCLTDGYIQEKQVYIVHDYVPENSDYIRLGIQQHLYFYYVFELVQNKPVGFLIED